MRSVRPQRSSGRQVARRLVSIAIGLVVVVAVMIGLLVIAALLQSKGVPEDVALDYLTAVSEGDLDVLEEMTDLSLGGATAGLTTGYYLNSAEVQAGMIERVSDVAIVSVEASDLERAGRRGFATIASKVTFEYTLAGERLTGEMLFGKAEDGTWKASRPAAGRFTVDAASTGFGFGSVMVNGAAEISSTTWYWLYPGVYAVAPYDPVSETTTGEGEPVTVPVSTSFTYTLR